MDLKLQVMLARLRSEPSNLTTSMSDMADMATQNSTTVIITLTWPNKMGHLKNASDIEEFGCSIAQLPCLSTERYWEAWINSTNEPRTTRTM